MSASKLSSSTLVGWREWAVLPQIGIPAIKAKIDTGARTSAIHAFDIERYRVDGADHVRFSMQPLQRNKSLVIQASAPLVDIRQVSDSGGHSENRLVITTELLLGSLKKDIELSLTERHSMLFRMLIGRTALSGDVLVDPAASFLCGKKSTRLLYASLTEESAS